jgi:hypothetical protein
LSSAGVLPVIKEKPPLRCGGTVMERESAAV